MNKLLDTIMQRLISGGYVHEDEAEVVRFGLELTIMKLIISAFMLTAAVIMKSFIAVLVFMAVYQPMRSCCGGYHAKTRLSCFTFSMLILTAVIALSKLVHGNIRLYAAAALICISMVLILILAPVDTPSKPFDDIERRVFRKRSLMAAGASVVIASVTAAFRLYTPMLSIAAAVFFTALLLLIGRITNTEGAKI